MDCMESIREKDMKKLILISCIITITMSLITRCISSNSDYITPDQQADKLTVQIFDCFINNDSETLKSLFSSNVQESHDLDTEIKEAFYYIGGDIISYDEPDGTIQGKSRRAEEGITQLVLGGVITNIKTDTGKTYRISFTSYAINKDDEDDVGVISIGVIDEELEKQSDYDLYNVDFKRRIGGN